jgi:hypothetical protein
VFSPRLNGQRWYYGRLFFVLTDNSSCQKFGSGDFIVANCILDVDRRRSISALRPLPNLLANEVMNSEGRPLDSLP